MGISRRKERSRKRIRTFTFTRTIKHKIQLIEWLFGPIDPGKNEICSLDCIHQGTCWCKDCIDHEHYEQ